MPHVTVNVDDTTVMSLDGERAVTDLIFVSSQTLIGTLPCMLNSIYNRAASPPHCRVVGGACGLLAFAFTPVARRITHDEPLLHDVPNNTDGETAALDGGAESMGLSHTSLGFQNHPHRNTGTAPQTVAGEH